MPQQTVQADQIDAITLENAVIKIPRSVLLSSIGPFSTAQTMITPTFLIPANVLRTGDTFRIAIYGQCTTSVAGTTTFTVRYGSTGTVADTAIMTTSATSALTGTGIGFSLTSTATVRSIGATGSMVAASFLSSTGVLGIATGPVVQSTGTPISINTTTANYISISGVTSNTLVTLTIHQATVDRLL